MTHYATCMNCAADKPSCQKRSALRVALKGQHVFSLKFKCSDRVPYFTPGQRIEFDWTLWDSDGYDSYDLPLLFHGTVIRERGTRFVVQVDRGRDASGEDIEASEVFKKNDQLLVKVRPADMRSIGEPPRMVCGTCYWVEGAAEDRCYQSGDYLPVGCIDRLAAREAKP